jgi:MoCo/4Fe-4S cofactor protein with predicted Tat translocation signal
MKTESSPSPRGRAYWRSLEELADAPELHGLLAEHAPRHAAELGGALDRRRFLQLMAASIGLAGLAGCRRPELEILPYSKTPDDVIPGLPTFYATAMPRPGGAFPVLAESHEGRPTKIEGNPGAPDSLGSTDAFAQASILDLYDPDRSRSVLKGSEPSSWDAFDAWAAPHFAALRKAGGKGLYVLAEDIESPSLALVRAHLKETMPAASWHAYEPIGADNPRNGAALAFDGPAEPQYDFAKAGVVLALDCDFLGLEDRGVNHVRGFAEARAAGARGGPMARLYAVEPTYTLTGGMADHRLRLPASHVQEYALALAQEILVDPRFVQVPGSKDGAFRDKLKAFKPRIAIAPHWVDKVADDLRAHRGRGIIIAGRRQPPLVHALAHALNEALGNHGATITFRRPPSRDAGTLAELTKALVTGKVNTLVILGGNPAYNAPADLPLLDGLRRVEHTIRLGTHVDETSARASWHLPMAHYLESWGDGRTSDGTVVPIQPLIEPLFGGRTALEVVAQLAGFETTSPYEIARRALRGFLKEGEDLDVAWRQFLHDGFRDGTARPTVKPGLKYPALAEALDGPKPEPPPQLRLDAPGRRPAQTAARPAPPPAGLPSPPQLSEDNLEVVFLRDAKVDDGRFANNGWLQEAPEPISKLTWDNAALIGPTTARDLGVSTGDVVRLSRAGRTMEIVALVLPGQADYSIAVALGYGRTAAGRVGDGVGFNTYPLRTSDAPDFTAGVKLARAYRTYSLAITQEHDKAAAQEAERREPAREQDVGEKPEPREEHEDIYDRPAFASYHQWGMAIDLNLCVGCNACLVACQAENNVPIVGKDEVRRGREMHWIRNDRYFSGEDENDPGMIHQPVACQHCEAAPCEVVCPVNAAAHSEEGLNLQAYNRCIGTRYCANNCPYKVRRFNWFNYNERPLDKLRLGPLTEKGMAETLKMQKNPDVTVRIRGVMEKCTYCVQRIERAKIGARVAAGDSDDYKVPDGTIVPACAQACPARAIVFGDISDRDSKVSQAKAQGRDYALLGELNTRPRTTYQARLRNPNPAMRTDGEQRA